jgi:hypothetical protein
VNHKLEDVQKVALWVNLRYFLENYWETLRTTTGHLSEDSCYPGWYLNQASPRIQVTSITAQADHAGTEHFVFSGNVPTYSA